VYKIIENTLYVTFNRVMPLYLAHSSWLHLLCSGYIIPLSHTFGIFSLIHIHKNVCFSHCFSLSPTKSNSAGVLSIPRALWFFHFFSAISISSVVGASVMYCLSLRYLITTYSSKSYTSIILTSV